MFAVTESPPLELRKREVSEAGRLYVDSVVDGVVLVFMREDLGVSRIVIGLLRNLAGVIKGVARRVLTSALHDATSDEVDAMYELLRRRLVFNEGGDPPGWLVYPLEPAIEEHFRRAIAGAKRGDPCAEREAFVGAMIGMTDESIRFHYDEPFGLLRLGYVTSKALHFGRGAIRAAAHTTTRNGIGACTELQLMHLAEYLETSMVP